MDESERTRLAISEETGYFIERLLKVGSHIDRPLQWIFDEALKEFDRQKERYLE